mmetsp:Transcript_8986/g.8875  ORF Transcript_8986/g.8875 Transcript_8986/m.8875 type:complete len:282 (+) Transcript_8986:100-945(+)|eukprot:CAMPEP_0119033756 /NCGR_PEP_ID=MMETSP1177-20130426/821_1 /TAXON_ID=2985 /ORGANISM="Ochromonas sp, Strain CCMP1899" /LENGTH=281 /DNA_ID=CAMNT_0006990747 /DNA_START=78 /DNA_END=923 /DNA_ORIENTATION=+
MYWIFAVVLLFQIKDSCSFTVSNRFSNRIAVTKSLALQAASGDENEGRDLTGHSLWIKFTGFGVEDMNFAIELNDKFQAVYSRGLESAYPGFWRVVKYDDGRETVEVTQPVLPEYMLFFDLWEASILWRGKLDPVNNRITDGEVITNKKRFGLFPYTETLATFEADLLMPGKKLPEVELPSFEDLRFAPPDSFDSPFDMKSYPQLFDPKFVDYFFQSEDAASRDEDPPERPKQIFIAKPDAYDGEMIEEDEDVTVGGKSLVQKKSVGTNNSGKSFGNKKKN